MPAITTLGIMDGQGVPVSHNFSPKSVVGNLATFVDRSPISAVGFNVLTISVVSPTKTNKNYKIRLKMVTPILETVNASTYSGITPAPTKAYDVIFDGEFTLPERSTLIDRQNILAMVRSLFANGNVTTVVTQLENIW